MRCWLVKSEPFKYSWETFVQDEYATWDGVRNYAARNNLKSMKCGDLVLFYHSNEGLEIIGIAEVLKEAYQDPTTTENAWVAVDLKPVKTLNRPVTMKQMKADKRLADMALLRLSRLSVQEVKPEEWQVIMELAGEK
jgi:predicted RNA-binding protein with PUA-like domain